MVGAANYGNATIIMAEGRTLKDGIQAAIAVGYRMLDIEGDNLIVIEALQRMTEIPWQIRNVIKDEVILSQDVHIYREANITVD